jgi:hypothetical protein
MAEKLFSEEFIATLAEMNRFDNPMVVKLCKDTMPSNVKLKEAVERWYGKLSNEQQNEIRTRLQHLEDKVFQSAFFELALKEHFEESGFKVDFEPELQDGTTPDFRLKANGSEAYVEVRTIMEPEDEGVNRKRKNDALNQIDKIATKYVLSIHFEKQPESEPTPSALREAIKEWLKELSIAEKERAEKLFEVGGYVVEVNASNAAGYSEGTNRIMFSGGPTGFLGRSLGLMHRGIKKKAEKYKDLQRAGKPYVVAICSTDMNFVLEDIWMMIAAYGSLQGEVNDRGTFSLSGEKPKNKGVSGVLHCKLLQDQENFRFQINFYENPFAGTKMPEEFGWRNNDSSKSAKSKGCLPLVGFFAAGVALCAASLLGQFFKPRS